MKEDTLPLRLDRPTDLPAVFLDRAAGLGALLQRWDYMEQLLENGDFRSLAEDLDAYILERKVSGYHCTKELYSGFFETRGLRPLSAAAHIEEFIDYANTRIPPELLARFRAAYDEWLKHKQIPHREGMICFCMSPYLVKHDGTDRFFKYYGGEALAVRRGRRAPRVLERAWQSGRR